MNVFDATDLESAIKKVVIDGGVTSTVFANRPKAKEQGADFAVVSVVAGIDDLAAYGDTEVSVDLFARDVNNVKNTKKLSKMYRALMEAMPAEVGRYMISTTPLVMPDVEDDYGYTARIVNFPIIIKHE